ncbi:MAG: DUF1801 domain-containing protein [Planctomycetales bacterium]
MQSKATTVAQYLSELPEERRSVLSAVRKVILENLDADYEEGMQYGMIGYYVPHRVYPAGYHCNPAQPVPFACLASQKNHMSLYLMCVYLDSEQHPWFESAWKQTGKKLDMGKSCVRFKKLDDVALEVVGEAIRRNPVWAYLKRYESLLAGSKATSSASKPKKGKAPAKKSAAPSRRSAKRTSAAKPKPRRAAGKSPSSRSGRRG